MQIETFGNKGSPIMKAAKGLPLRTGARKMAYQILDSDIGEVKLRRKKWN
jgi:hypothetical protein